MNFLRCAVTWFLGATGGSCGWLAVIEKDPVFLLPVFATVVGVYILMKEKRE